jgi:hypothetical protein
MSKLALICAALAVIEGVFVLGISVVLGAIGLVVGSIALARAREESAESDFRRSLFAIYASLGFGV